MTASYGLRQTRHNREVLLLELSDVDIRIDPKQRFKPSSVSLEDPLLADIVFEQDLERAYNGQEIVSINRNSVQLKLKAAATARTSTRELVSAWHFDRHNYPGMQSNSCHPTYHWQFGGWGLRNLSEDIRGVLVTDSPRLFAPPMDLVLASTSLFLTIMDLNGTVSARVSPGILMQSRTPKSEFGSPISVRSTNSCLLPRLVTSIAPNLSCCQTLSEKMRHVQTHSITVCSMFSPRIDLNSSGTYRQNDGRRTENALVT